MWPIKGTTLPVASHTPGRWRVEVLAQLRLGASLALVHAGQAIMGVVDTVVVGRLSATHIAAVGLGHAIYMAAYIISLGVLSGLEPLMAQAVGAKKPARATELLLQGAWLVVVLTVVWWGVLALVGPLLPQLDAGEDLLALTGNYILWRAVGLMPALWFVVCRVYLQAVSTTRPLVLAMVYSNLFNVALVVLAVHGGAGLPTWLGPLHAFPAMGAVGAAAATSLCALFQWAYVMPAVRRAWSRAHHAGALQGRRLWPQLGDLLQVLRLGLPLGLQMGAEMGAFSLTGIFAGMLGDVPMASHQVALTAASLSFTVSLGVASAASVRVGYAVGAQDFPSVRLRGTVAFILGAVFMGSVALLFSGAPHAVAGVFTTQEAVLAQTASLLGVAAVFQLADGAQAVGAGVLRGAGDTRFLSVANVVGHYGVGLPLALWLAGERDLGLTGLWWGLCAGLFAVAALLVARFAWISQKPVTPVGAALAP